MAKLTGIALLALLCIGCSSTPDPYDALMQRDRAVVMTFESELGRVAQQPPSPYRDQQLETLRSANESLDRARLTAQLGYASDIDSERARYYAEADGVYASLEQFFRARNDTRRK